VYTWGCVRCVHAQVRVADAVQTKSGEHVHGTRAWCVHGVCPPSQPGIASMNGHLDHLPHSALEPILRHLVPHERLELGTARLAAARWHRWRRTRRARRRRRCTRRRRRRTRRARRRRRTRRARRRSKRRRRKRRRRKRRRRKRRRRARRRRKWRRRNLSYTFAARRFWFAGTRRATWRPVARPRRQILRRRRLLGRRARLPGTLLDGHLLILIVKVVGEGLVLCGRRPGRPALQNVDHLVTIHRDERRVLWDLLEIAHGEGYNFKSRDKMRPN